MPYAIMRFMKTGVVKPTAKINPTKSEMNIPDYAIERLARCMLPLIQRFYESDEGQREMAKWTKQPSS